MRSNLTLLALVGFSASAFAAAPHPTAIDADKDGAFAATVDVNGDSKKDHLDIGIRAKDLDCDDTHANVSPRLAEIVGDGIDNDCSGADANWPAGVTDVVAARFLANSGAKSPTVFIVEYDACKAATECDVDSIAGTFAIKASEQDKYKFADIYVNGSKVLRNSGQKPDGREVVTVEEVEHFRGISASGSGSYSGPSKATRTAEALAIATPLVTAEAEIRAEADIEFEKRISVIVTGNAGRDEELNRQADVDGVLESRIASSWDAIDDEAKARAEADSLIQIKAEIALDTANMVASHGPLLEAGPVVGGIFHRGLNESGGDPVRGSTIGNGAFELRVGVDGSGYEVAGFGQVFFGSDGQGTGPDIGYLIGADVVFDTGSVQAGPWVAFVHTDDHVNYVDLSVIENGGLIGVEFQGDIATDSAVRIVPFARLGVGVGYYGTKGLTEDGPVVVSDYGGLGLLQAGVRFGAGALKD